MSANILNSENLRELGEKADLILDKADHDELRSFFNSLLEVEYKFDNFNDEARFFYILGNCSQELYSYHNLEWFSEDLSLSVIFFRKALYAIKQIDFLAGEELHLQSCIETNLGNSLSSQGRAFCCISLWDNAMRCKSNPVPILSKANHELFLANNLYDQSHTQFHYFKAYQLIQLGLEHLELLHPEYRAAYADGSDLMNFKSWFEDTFKEGDFSYFDSYKMDYESRKQRDYLKWCAENRLFINDLNDVSLSEIVYQDIINLPSISQLINPTLSRYEELMYHGNFDELKNDYCYARYLTFSAKDIPDDHPHFFNNTYPQVNDMSYSITNLKASHYKSAFRILYSLFDKIAYFIHRFFDLNDIKNDRKINFDSIFRKIDKKEWRPHTKLKDSQNYFIHALFYVLKDIRDVGDSPSVSRWLDPDAKAFSDIRNALEHRSLKIIDDFGYVLTQSDKIYKQAMLEKLNLEINGLEIQIEELSNDIISAKKSRNDTLKLELENKKQMLSEELSLARLKNNQQQKLSRHSVLIKVSEFESRLMMLMKLARNSIMYLSLAIHIEEQNQLDTDKLIMHREVPLK